MNNAKGTYGVESGVTSHAKSHGKPTSRPTLSHPLKTSLLKQPLALASLVVSGCINRVVKLWFWLTTSYACASCRKVSHQAWIDLGPQEIECADGSRVRLPRISHGYCRDCFNREFGKLSTNPKASFSVRQLNKVRSRFAK